MPYRNKELQVKTGNPTLLQSYTYEIGYILPTEKQADQSQHKNKNIAYNTLVRPVVVYGGETRTLTSNTKKV